MTLKKLLFFALCLFCMTAVNAVPAKRGVFTITQADGSELRIQMRGDEHHHIVLSEDDYLLLEQNGVYYFADCDAAGNLVPSAVKAQNKGMRSTQTEAFVARIDKQKQLQIAEAQRASLVSAKQGSVSSRMHQAPRRNPGLFDYSFPVTGDVKGLVVLVEYTDTKFNTNYDPASYFTRMMNERGFSDYGGTGCVEEYFEQQSNGLFKPKFDVYGPITLSHNMAYYGGNDWSGNDQYAWQMPIEACQQLDAEVDFSEYDTNNDGYIDNIFVFYAGKGEASGGAANTVWPHSWNISDATYTPYYFDGVRLDRYACSNEWESGKPDGIGTFVHEFSHVMGLPDLYATSYTSAFTPGDWTVMDDGCYNNDSRTPPAYSVYERYSLDWIEPQVLDGPNSVQLPYIGDTNQGCIIKTEKENEFFLLENRQKQDWDKYIPGHGMLVWHIDYNESVWESNTVNNTSSHQYVDLEEADGSQTEYSRDGDAFPGTSKKTSFTDDTKPSMKTWSGKRLNLPITNITEKNGEISFDIAGGIIEVAAPVAAPATDVTATTARLTWQAVENAESYQISVYTKGEDNSCNYLQNLEKQNVGNVLEKEISGLQPETDYFYVVYAVRGEVVSEPSNEVAFTTEAPSFSDNVIELLPATDVKAESFTASWKVVEGALEYQLELVLETSGDIENHDTCDFTGGISAIPAGWTSTSKLTYANTAYSGADIPALRLSTTNSYISSPVYDQAVETLSFWHRGSSVPAGNSICLYTIGKDNQPTFFKAFEIVNEVGGQTILVDSLPAETYGIKIEYNMTESKGALAIDDIVIGYGRKIDYDWVYAFDDNPMIVGAEKAVDGIVCAEIINLQPQTTYLYNVKATDGTLFTAPAAKRIKVTTAKKEEDQETGVSLLKIENRMTVTDIMGHVLYRGAAVSLDALNLPAHSLYIINVGNNTKVIRK